MRTSVMIEARGLVKSFRSSRALAGLDLTVHAGTTMCLLGPNGAGKTTAVRILTTLLLTTQYLDEADRLADRICVINGGRVTAEGSPAELKTRAGTSYLRLTVPAAVSLTRVAEEVSGYAAGPPRRLAGHHGLDIPVVPRPGLVTEIVRVLDAAGIAVDDVAVRPPSLDDVFALLTGGAAA